MAQNIFVAMPFKHSFDPVLDLIKDAAKVLNAQAARLDEEPITGSIVSHIRSQIDECDLMVAVVSEENGNVYYEIGLAHCQKKPVVILTADPTTLKFDLRDHRAIVYEPQSPKTVRDELIRTIKAALDGPSGPTQFIESVFQSSGKEGDRFRAGLEKAKNTVVQEADLHLPVQVTMRNVDQRSRQLSLEVVDFFGRKIRAIFDINGILVKWQQI